MFPAETWSEIGAWLSDYGDFSNFAVALGVKWNPRTQAQRMIRKYGRDKFLSFIQIGDGTDDSAPTRTQRGYINFSTDQLCFYQYLVRRLPDVVAKEVHGQSPGLGTYCPEDALERLEPLLKFGVKINNVSTRSLSNALYYAPAVIELLAETGQIGFPVPADPDFVPEDDGTFLLFGRMLRWGLSLDLDFLLNHCVRRLRHWAVPDEHRVEIGILIHQLLDHGANPKAVTAVPCTPEIMIRLLEGGADPDGNRWSTKILDFGVNDLWILDTWILDYGWVPRASEYRADPPSVFGKLALHQRWAAATVLLEHFGVALGEECAKLVRSFHRLHVTNIPMRQPTFTP
ncbi:hypothetical protein HK102_012095, partial [Quaeritorhiza haematococci]